MGKSTLALAVCDELLASYPDGVWFVDLAPISDPALVASALATALGVGIDEADPMRTLGAYVRERRMLVLMDNCERVVEAAAVLAVNLLTSGRHVNVLATSREPLGAKGEWLQRLPPLVVPERRELLTAHEAMTSPAVQLFVDRAVASVDGFELSDWEAAGVAEICRRLDGMPFAIELAAAHVDVFGISGLLTQLNDRFPVLPQSRRAVPERHQTLRALLDWSYNLLTDLEKAQLRNISVFTASFNLDAAIAVGAADDVSPNHVSDGIAALASKSLIVVVSDGDEVRYRLLDTTRAYALERLAESSQVDEVRRRHARYMNQLLKRAESDWATMTRQDWIVLYGAYMDDVRAALEWATFSRDGLVEYVQLVAVAGGTALAFILSLQSEFLRRIELAMERYRAGTTRDSVLELNLCLSLAGLLANVKGPQDRQIDTLYCRALELATELRSDAYRAATLDGMFVVAFIDSDYRVALGHAEALAQLASQSDDSSMMLTADRLKAQCLFKLGSIGESRCLAERVLRSPMKAPRLAYPYPMDRRVAMRILLAQILWIEGCPEQALRVAQESVVLSESEAAFPHSISLGFAACPIALWTGDLDLAANFIDRLQLLSRQYGFNLQSAWAREFARVLASKGHQGLSAAGSDGMTSAASSIAPISDVMGTMGERFLTDEAIARLDSGRAEWCAAEILRAQGERSLLAGTSQGAALAESLYERSLSLAREQGALSWELRTATSMAELARTRGRSREAHAELTSVFQRFTEGFETSDLVRARELLVELAADLDAS